MHLLMLIARGAFIFGIVNARVQHSVKSPPAHPKDSQWISMDWEETIHVWKWFFMILTIWAWWHYHPGIWPWCVSYVVV